MLPLWKQSGPGTDGNEEILHIRKSSSITGASQSDCLISYPGHSLGIGLTLQQRCSRCILQFEPTGLQNLCTNHCFRALTIRLKPKLFTHKLFAFKLYIYVCVCVCVWFAIFMNKVSLIERKYLRDCDVL